MNRNDIAKLAATALLLIGGIGFAAQDDGRAGHDRDGNAGQHGRSHRGSDASSSTRRTDMLIRHLGLDDSQAEQLRNITSAAEPQMSALREAMRESREAFDRLDPGAEDYSIALENLASKAADSARQLTLLRGQLRAETHAILTPDQREKLADGIERQRSQKGRRGAGGPGL